MERVKFSTFFQKKKPIGVSFCVPPLVLLLKVVLAVIFIFSFVLWFLLG